MHDSDNSGNGDSSGNYVSDENSYDGELLMVPMRMLASDGDDGYDDDIITIPYHQRLKRKVVIMVILRFMHG